MPFQTRCPECRASFTVEDLYLGRWVHCAECRGKFQARPQVDPPPSRPEDAPVWTGHDPSPNRPAANTPSPDWLRKGGMGIGSVLFALFIGFRVLMAFMKGCPADSTPRPGVAWKSGIPEEHQPPALDELMKFTMGTPPRVESDIPAYLGRLKGLPPENRTTRITRIRSEETARLFARFLTRPEYRTEVSQVLVMMQQPARKPVMEYLTHPDRATRFEAWTIIGRIGAQENLHTLEAARAREKDRDVLYAATEAIKAIRK